MLTYIRQGWLVLLLGLVFGTALAGVNSWLAPMIAENEKQARQDAALAVIPSSTEAEIVQIQLGDETTTVYCVTGEGGVHLGWAVPASGQGYADRIDLIVGVNAAATNITDFRVIYNQETPGLGNKIVGGGFRKRFGGKDARKQLMAVNSPTPGDNQIQALTGATISSQAVCDIIYTQLSESGLLAELAKRAGGSAATDTEN